MESEESGKSSTLRRQPDVFGVAAESVYVFTGTNAYKYEGHALILHSAPVFLDKGDQKNTRLPGTLRELRLCLVN